MLSQVKLATSTKQPAFTGRVRGENHLDMDKDSAIRTLYSRDREEYEKAMQYLDSEALQNKIQGLPIDVVAQLGTNNGKLDCQVFITKEGKQVNDNRDPHVHLDFSSDYDIPSYERATTARDFEIKLEGLIKRETEKGSLSKLIDKIFHW